MLGRIQPGYFPRVFGPGADQPLDAETVRDRFAALAGEIGDGRSPEEVAAGFLEIAVANMANAIKKISVQRGYDVTEYVLATFGGAGGQHACAVADALGMTRILIHPYAGVLSAYGMGLADVTAMRETALEIPLNDRAGPDLQAALDRLEAQAHAELTGQGVPAERIRAAHRVHLRYDGTDTRARRPGGVPADHGQGVRRGLPAALLVPDARQADHGGGRLGRAHRRLRARRRWRFAAASPGSRPRGRPPRACSPAAGGPG